MFPASKFLDHVAIAVKQGELEGQVKSVRGDRLEGDPSRGSAGNRSGARGAATDWRRAEFDSAP